MENASEIVPLKTAGQADWLLETFFEERLKTNNTDGRCLKCNLCYNNVVTRVLAKFVIIIALCNKIVALCNNTGRILKEP